MTDSFAIPVHVRHETDAGLPRIPVCYVLARNGLFLARETPFFTSCTPVRGFPPDLAEQAILFLPRFPRIPRVAWERIVGFFSAVEARQGSEAAVLLAWDGTAGRVRLVVPEQIATVTRGARGDITPHGVQYRIPHDLPAGWTLYGSVHSHVHYAAFCSGTDIADDVLHPGLHLVVGRIAEDPPDVHAEAAVDGERFPLDPRSVIEDYGARDHGFPRRWLDRVSVTALAWNREMRSELAERLAERSGWETDELEPVAPEAFTTRAAPHPPLLEEGRPESPAECAGETGGERS